MQADDRIRRWLSTTNSSEALEWFQQANGKNRRLLGLLRTTGKSQAMVQSLYDFGAVKIWAMGIKHYAWGEEAGALVLELPDDKTMRKKLFEREAEIARASGFDPSQDSGQRMMLLKLD